MTSSKRRLNDQKVRFLGIGILIGIPVTTMWVIAVFFAKGSLAARLGGALVASALYGAVMYYRNFWQGT